MERLSSHELYSDDENNFVEQDFERRPEMVRRARFAVSRDDDILSHHDERRPSRAVDSADIRINNRTARTLLMIFVQLRVIH